MLGSWQGVNGRTKAENPCSKGTNTNFDTVTRYR